MKGEAILFFFGCSEGNSTWIITSELARQRARKVLFTCVRSPHGLLLVWYVLMLVIRLTKTPDPRISWPRQLGGVFMMERSTQNEKLGILRRVRILGRDWGSGCDSHIKRTPMLPINCVKNTLEVQYRVLHV